MGLSPSPSLQSRFAGGRLPGGFFVRQIDFLEEKD